MNKDLSLQLGLKKKVLAPKGKGTRNKSFDKVEGRAKKIKRKQGQRDVRDNNWGQGSSTIHTFASYGF